MPLSMEDIVEQLPTIRAAIEAQQEILLANLVMMGECPAPTFGEERRSHLLQDRFRMSGLDNVSSDDFGNALGILPGTGTGGTIAVLAHLDSVLDESMNHAVTVGAEEVFGVSLSNNALGLAVIASLPTLLEHQQIELQHDLLLMGHVRALGAGNLEGLTGFLDNTGLQIESGVSLDALQLGRISHRSIGMLRGRIRVSVPKEYDWTRGAFVGAIQVICDIVDRIHEIPLPRKPLTFVVMGSIHSGNTYNVMPTDAVLRFEIRSESAEQVERIFQQIEEIAVEAGSNVNVDVMVDVVARRQPGGIEFSHPLTRSVRRLIDSLDLETHVSPSTSELAAFTERNIKAITLGLTKGEENPEGQDTLAITPLFDGVTLLIGTLLAIDHGHGADDE